MKKTLSLIMTAFMLFSLIPVAVMAEETAGETPTEQEYIRYMFDFDSEETTPVITNKPSNVTIEEYNGSKALKVAGNGTWMNFSIELPEAVNTRYVLVKIKGTPETSNTLLYQATPSYRDSSGNEAMRFRYWYDKQIQYGKDNTFTDYTRENLHPYPSAGVPDKFEAVMDLSTHTVSFGDKTGYLLKQVSDIKSLVFESDNNANATVYFDDIEVIGFNDYSAIQEPSYEVISITTDGAEVTALADAKGKTLEISIEKTGDFEVIGAIYDGSKLICADVLDNGIVSLDVPEDADTENYTTKIFAWDSLEVLSPIFDARPIFE